MTTEATGEGLVASVQATMAQSNAASHKRGDGMSILSACANAGTSRTDVLRGRYDTLRVFRRMKSIRMNCPNVIVFVK
jgi:hypothetical protein